MIAGWATLCDSGRMNEQFRQAAFAETLFASVKLLLTAQMTIHDRKLDDLLMRVERLERQR
jgi:hypothetical protein